MTPPHQRSELLAGYPHGFFGREGGVSKGVYTSLNGGPGSGDNPDAVTENRRRMHEALNTPYLVTAYQTHSADAAFVDKVPDQQIRADALVTDHPDIAIGVLAADCVPVLFTCGPLVGAAHAGWRGSLSGILEATVSLMEDHGADICLMRAAIGPCLRAPAFEVGSDLIEEVTCKYPNAEKFFSPKTDDKSVYDHAAFVKWRLVEAGLKIDHVEDVGGCTLTHPERWFSYRASRARKEPDYGRNLSAIAVRAA